MVDCAVGRSTDTLYQLTPRISRCGRHRAQHVCGRPVAHQHWQFCGISKIVVMGSISSRTVCLFSGSTVFIIKTVHTVEGAIVTRPAIQSVARATAGCIAKRRFRSGNMVRNSNRRQEEESGGPHGARRVSARHWRPILALAVCIASVGWAPQSAQAQRGYDREENPTGIWQGFFFLLFQLLLVSVYESVRILRF